MTKVRPDSKHPAGQPAEGRSMSTETKDTAKLSNVIKSFGKQNRETEFTAQVNGLKSPTQDKTSRVGKEIPHFPMQKNLTFKASYLA